MKSLNLMILKSFQLKVKLKFLFKYDLDFKIQYFETVL